MKIEVIIINDKVSRKKNKYFTVRYTVSVDPAPYGQLFVIFFGVL